MPSSPYLPVLVRTRASIRESIHFGAIAVVDSSNTLVASYGDPNTITFLRSTAKPLQALPFIEHGGHCHWGLTQQEIAILCASHAGTNDHAETVHSIQTKIQVKESDLLCGSHPPMDSATAFRLRVRGEEPTPNRHNCSGKHTGMLAFARLRDLPIADYINPEHPIQNEILETFCEMCGIDLEAVALGTDGCSAPNFAIPLRNTALGFARLCDPITLAGPRADACKTITQAMSAHPDMVSGPGRFDTRIMEVMQGRVIAKGGAEGYQGLGIMPGALAPNSPGIGIAFKISDGDLKNHVRPAVALEILRQLGAISAQQLAALTDFAPQKTIKNWRKLTVGASRPVFELKK